MSDAVLEFLSNQIGARIEFGLVCPLLCHMLVLGFGVEYNVHLMKMRFLGWYKRGVGWGVECTVAWVFFFRLSFVLQHFRTIFFF